jgi:hypothetical protein
MTENEILLTNTLRDVVNSWEQGGTPLEVDAAINRAADILALLEQLEKERLEKDAPK